MKKTRIGILLLASILLVSGLVCGDGAHRVWTDKDKTYLGSDTIEVDSIFRSRLIWFMGLSSAPDDSEGMFYYNTTADPGTAYYYDGTSWIAIGYATGGDSVMYADSAGFADSAGITKTGFVQSLWDAIQDSCDTVAYADSSIFADSALWADSTAHAQNAESLGGVEAPVYLFATAQDTVTASLYWNNDLYFFPGYGIYLGIDTVAFSYSNKTLQLTTMNRDLVDLYMEADSFVFQTYGEAGRGFTWVDSSGTVLMILENDGDLWFNVTDPADLSAIDTITANRLVGWADSANFALNTDSLGGIVAGSYLRSDTEDTATGKLHFYQDLCLYQNVYTYWTISDDTVGFSKYNQGTWFLDLEDGIDHYSRADSFVYQTQNEDGRAWVLSDSSGDVIALFENDGDMGFNPGQLGDIWFVDTIQANVFDGWADSALHADTTLWADSAAHSLNSDSLGGVIVPDDILLSSRIDTMPCYLFFDDNIFLEDGKTFYLSHDGLSGFITETNVTHHMTVGTGETYSLKLQGEKIRVMSRAEGTDTLAVFADSSGDIRLSLLNDGTIGAETFLVQSDGEIGPLAVFSDSSSDDVLTIYNEGGITLAKNWQGIGTWSGSNRVETLAVVGISTNSIALVTACNTFNGELSWDCWTDTCVVTRSSLGAPQDSFGYLILR